MVDIYLSLSSNDIKFLIDKYEDFDVHILDYENISIMELFKRYFETSLLGNKNLYIVKNAKFLFNKSDKLKVKETEVFLDILKKESQNKLIFLVDKKINTSIAYLNENKELYNYSENIQKESQKLFLKSYNININDSDLNYLIENISEGYNYQNELMKLSIYKDNGKISKEDIDEQIKLKPSVNIFSFIEAIVLKDFSKANIYYKKIKENEDMSQEQILAVMHTQLKFFTQVKILRDKHIVDNQISSILKCSPYRLKLSNKLLLNTNIDILKDLYNKVSKYDYLIKSGQTKEKDVIINFLIS